MKGDLMDMMMGMKSKEIFIESKNNQTYKTLLKYKDGIKEEGIFLAEGIDLFDEAKIENCLLGVILLSDSDLKIKDYPVYRLTKELYRNLSCYQSLPKIISICQKKLDKNVGDKVIYLDGIQDPGNFGTIIRTALAFSYTGVAFSFDSVSPYNNKTIQASKGAIFHLPLWKENLKYYKDNGYNIYVTTLDGEDEKKYDELLSPFVLAFGNEGHGIRKENLNLGKKLKIEMSSIDSLNVAVSSGIFMYRFKK